MPLPPDYLHRVYAGILGKIIGVYLGRPFEGWGHQRILDELGEINYYVHERLGVPLVVTDDDISGTFTFIRAMEDHAAGRSITAEQIGRTWLNYLVEGRTVLWWGGMGNSTEHTAYLRLKHGIPAPRSGAIETNSKVVAEQIGAQIFIDGWAMIAPGDPQLATELARKAASVSHDGEAIHGAQVIAAIESMAFVESDLNRLLDTAVSFIPGGSLIARMIADLREWRRREPDWRKARELLDRDYGYHKYGGNCHIVPNHGVVILALLWGQDSFQKSLMIANTCGWDTDCNSGNVGCIMGIKNGLAGIDAGPDFRTPVADRLLLPTADGGSCITDAVTQTCRLVNIGRSLAGEPALSRRNDARFDFSLPGSVQGFMVEDSPESRGTATLDNPDGGGLRIRYRQLAPGRPCRLATATFLTPQLARIPGYGLAACPTLYPGQTLCARLIAEARHGAVTCRPYLGVYDERDQLRKVYGPEFTPLANAGPEGALGVHWPIPPTAGQPIAEVGVEIAAASRADGILRLDHLTWDGEPSVTLARPDAGMMWQRAWVNAMDVFDTARDENTYRLISNERRGLLIQGTRDWRNYRVSAAITPFMLEAAGIAARVGGLRRYYALLLCAGRMLRLVRMLDESKVLAEAPFDWQFRGRYELALEVSGERLTGWVDGREVVRVEDRGSPLCGGGVALVCEIGRMAAGPVSIVPAGGSAL